MVRDTRSSKETKSDQTPASKRKRRPSPTPPPPPASATPIKINLHVPASTSPNPQPRSGGPKIRIVPSKSNGSSAEIPEEEQESKRARISLKVNGDGEWTGQASDTAATATAPKSISTDAQAPDQEDEAADVMSDIRNESPENTARQGRLLTREVRAALAIVIARCAAHLPSPLNGILTLSLPPTFVQDETNTLGHALKQDDLTWEQLVDVLHLLAKNLLAPCAYPNPLPSLTHFHDPIPPLPSHFDPHDIHSFCATLHAILSQVEPSEATKAAHVERWAIMQKIPVGSGTMGGDWFTSSVDIRQVESILEKLDDGKQFGAAGSLLHRLAASGSRFGHAIPVSLQAAIHPSSSNVVKTPTLSESLIRRASLKATRWKEARVARRHGGFGSICRPVRIPTTVHHMPFTPAFAPTYDSTAASDLGYWGTLDAMHERCKTKEYEARIGRDAGLTEGYYGMLDTPAPGTSSTASRAEKVKTVDEDLADNAMLLSELSARQVSRIRMGSPGEIDESELDAADRLHASLTYLASHTVPRSLLREGAYPGMAHAAAQRLITTRSPAIRGTLDPKRPQALHDNTTIRMRSQVAQSLGGSGNVSLPSPHQPPPPRSGPFGQMPPPPMPGGYGSPPPHILPPSTKPATSATGSPYGRAQQAYTPQRPGSATSGAPYRPLSGAGYVSPSSPAYGRPSPSPLPTHSQSSYVRPGGPGPSALRQSFGPLTPTPYAPLGQQRPVTMLQTQQQQQMRSGSTPSRPR